MNWEPHILLLDKILHWLEANEFTIILLICAYAIQETALAMDHTHWFETLAQKIDDILQIQAPKNLSQMYSFFGAVNHYQSIGHNAQTFLLLSPAILEQKPFAGPKIGSRFQTNESSHVTRLTRCLSKSQITL